MSSDPCDLSRKNQTESNLRRLVTGELRSVAWSLPLVISADVFIVLILPMPGGMVSMFMLSSAIESEVGPPGSSCVPSPRYCESEWGKRSHSGVVWKEGSGASRPPVKAADDEVEERSEGVSNRALLLSAVE